MKPCQQSPHNLDTPRTKKGKRRISISVGAKRRRRKITTTTTAAAKLKTTS